MATTSPNNLWSPDAANAYNLTVDLAAMQATVQTALNTKQNSFTTTAGWNNIAVASGWTGAIAYRQFGPIVMFRGYLSKTGSNIATGDMPLAAALPAAIIPANVVGVVQTPGPPPNQLTALTIDTSGVVRVHPVLGATQAFNVTFTYGL